MSNELEQAGTFRGQIIEYGLSEAQSGAVAVNVKVAINDIFHEGEWHDWREHEFVVGGQLWIIKKDGKLNNSQCEALILHAGWNGDITSIAQDTWKPTDIQVNVEADTYKDQTRFRISFIKGYDSTPGASTISQAKAKALQQKLGGELRAMAGNKSRNDAPAAGTPAKPKPGPAAKKPEPPAPAAETPPDDDIPFES